MYLGESVMVGACVIVAEHFLSILVYMLCMILRIQEEENLLLNTEQYRKYCVKTKWRLLLLVW